MLTVKISGTGSYLPTRVVTNEEISARIGSSPEWIYSHTGIASRHVADENESAATMGADAAGTCRLLFGVDLGRNACGVAVFMSR